MLCRKLNFPDNFSHTVGRINSLNRHLSKDAKLLVEYDEIFKTYQKEGIIVQITGTSNFTEPEHIYFSLH